MDIRPVAFDRLTSAELSAWSDIQQQNPLLGNPYFRPEFAAAVAAVRRDVEVAVIKEGGETVGFFPFQRSRWNSGLPVGSLLSDFHGVIGREALIVDPLELVRGCRLQSWHFDHCVSEQQAFVAFAWREAESPYIELPEGFDGYAEQGNGHRFLPEYGRKKRKLERDLGPVRFEAHVPEPAILAQLKEWKNSQYAKTGAPRLFDVPWINKVIDQVLESHSDFFAPLLSVMYTGDRVAAIALGMRSGATYHQWFPAYDVELYKHSPGVLLLIETMRAAQPLGIRRIDLGKGTEDYKQRCSNGAARVMEGTVDLRPTAAIVRRAWRETRQRIRSSPLAGPAHTLNRVRKWLAMR